MILTILVKELFSMTTYLKILIENVRIKLLMTKRYNNLFILKFLIFDITIIQLLQYQYLNYI